MTATATLNEVVTPEQFSRRLRELCTAKGINGSELARRMKVRQANASAWLRGTRTPSIDNAPTFAKAIGVTLDELFTDPADDDTDVPTGHSLRPHDLHDLLPADRGRPTQ